MGVWSYFTESLKKGRESKTANPLELRHLAQSAVLCLIDLGYLEAYEAGTGVCALTQLLVALQPEQWGTMDDLLPATAESIVSIVKQTTRWSVFASSRIAAQLLGAAFNSGETQLIRSMLDRGMDLYRVHDGRSCLEVVCGYHIEMDDDKRQTLFRMLLDHAGSTQLNDLSPVKQTGLIHEAAAGGSAWVVEELICRGADPNLRTGSASGSRPPLLFHLDLKKLNSARALLHHGADPTNQDTWGRDAALAAVERSQSSFLEELALAETSSKFSWRINWQQTCTLLGGNQRHTISGINALHLGADRSVDALRFYLDRQLLEVDSVDSDGDTPLMRAALTGQVRQVDYLCQKGANVNFQHRTYGWTALHCAVRGQSFSVVQALLQHGAQSLPDLKGRKPLILAYTMGNQGIIRALQQADTPFMLRHAPRATPSPVQETSSQQSQQGLAHALQVAIVSGNLGLCQQLHASGCHLDVDLGCGGCSPLILATRYKKFDIVKWLLETGASSTKVSCTRHGDASHHQTPFAFLLSQSTKVDTELIQLFIDKFLGEGGDIFQEHLVFLAANSNNTTALQLLLEQRERLATHPR
jgi:ankyrin repeat protein